jgi:hypothetical protein
MMSTIANTAFHTPNVTGIRPHVGFWVGLALIVVAVPAIAVTAYFYPVKDLVQVQAVAP